MRRRMCHLEVLLRLSGQRLTSEQLAVMLPHRKRTTIQAVLRLLLKLELVRIAGSILRPNGRFGGYVYELAIAPPKEIK